MFCESDNDTQDGCARESFADFMLAQIQTMEKFRQTIVRRTGREVTSEQAAFMWIERGYAAAFRRRFGPRPSEVALLTN